MSLCLTGFYSFMKQDKSLQQTYFIRCLGVFYSSNKNKLLFYLFNLLLYNIMITLFDLFKEPFLWNMRSYAHANTLCSTSSINI